MPIDIDDFEAASADDLDAGSLTPEEAVIEILAANPDRAFTRADLGDRTDLSVFSIAATLSKLENEGVVRHKGDYWAIGEDYTPERNGPEPSSSDDFFDPFES